MARASWEKLLPNLPFLHLVVRHHLLPLVHVGHCAILLRCECGLPQHVDTADERWPALNVLHTSKFCLDLQMEVSSASACYLQRPVADTVDA